jgi:hypothetical protein
MGRLSMHSKCLDFFSYSQHVPSKFPMGSHVFPNYVMGFNIHLLPIVAGDRQVAGQKCGSLR